MNYIALLVKYGPLLWNVVTNIETQLPNSAGKQKLDAAIAFVTATETELVGAEPAIAKAVGGIVAAFNKAGIFVKKSTPAVAGAATS